MSINYKNLIEVTVSDLVETIKYLLDGQITIK